MAKPEYIDISSDSSNRMFFAKLANGDFGLAKTYWFYGVLVGIGFNIITNLITSLGGLCVLFILYILYEIPVMIGVWRAANKYQGPKFWAVCAKVATAFGVIILIFSIFTIFSEILKNSTSI